MDYDTAPPPRRVTAPAAPKLRESCHVCAASKIKCNKEKPTCGRCARRGLACEYFVSKRAGRKQDNRPQNKNIITRPLPESTSTSEMDPLASPILIQPSPQQQTTELSDIFSSPFSSVDFSSWSMLTDFDDLNFPISGASHSSGMPARSHIDSWPMNNSLLDTAVTLDDTISVLDGTVSEAPALGNPPFLGQVNPLSPPNSRASTASDAPSLQGSRPDSSRCCLIQALGLLKQFFPNASTSCPSSRRQTENAISELPAIESVVTENEHVIEAMSNMLQCSCSQDGYLLTIMILIVFKVLDSYATVALETPSRDGSLSPSKSQLDGENEGRMAAQLVLSKLHRAQRLVNQLSQRLKLHGVHNERIDTSSSPWDSQDAIFDGKNAPFSATMLDQLEVDLRQRLRTLSMKLIDTLRRG